MKGGSGRHGNHARGSQHGKWNPGGHVSSQGYVKLRVGKTHPLADVSGYYEHLVVWCAAGNKAPGPDELLHHINADRTDNRIENLRLDTRSEHAKHHDAERGRDALGRFPSKARS